MTSDVSVTPFAETKPSAGGVTVAPETPPPASAKSGDNGPPAEGGGQLFEFDIPSGSHPHDVAPAADGTVWYTAQQAGALGRLAPATGESRQILLGDGSDPHGVIVGPDAAAWVTDGGLNAIVRMDPLSEGVTRFPLPPGSGNANLNTAVFDDQGVLWFAGQSALYGRLEPDQGQVEVFEAPRGRGPYGIAITPAGEIYFASLAGSYVRRIDPQTGGAGCPTDLVRLAWTAVGQRVECGSVGGVRSGIGRMA